jgi:hypothetical protein
VTRFYYSSNAVEASLTSGVNNVATSLQVDTITGYPTQFPFIIICEQGTSNEEIMLVTNVAGTTFTVTRGYDGSTAVSHSSGAKVVHGVSATPLNEASAHIEATSNVHGLSGGAEVVGTTQSQTLTNKTLTSPTVTGGTLNSSTLVTPTIASFANAQHNHTNAANGGAIGLSFIGTASNTSGSSGTVNTTYSDIPGMSITFTAPSAWQTGATKLAVYLVLATTFTAGSPQVKWEMDGVTVGEELFIESTSLAKPWMGIIPLPTVGVSHTLKARFRVSSGSASYTFLGAQLWASVV